MINIIIIIIIIINFVDQTLKGPIITVHKIKFLVKKVNNNNNNNINQWQ